jgi:Kef-type K+ transport system membrane component KefB
MALLTGRVRAGEPTQAEALGGILLCGGFALLFDVSFLLAAMTMGLVVANFARHHRLPLRAIEGIEWPFMVLFFVLSGASLELSQLGTSAALTAAYVVLRVFGRVVGGWLGSVLAGDMRPRTVGVALLPQAGIAIGMALVVSQRLPEIGPAILTATIAGTIVFEIAGPVLTRIVLEKSGETRPPEIEPEAALPMGGDSAP